MTKIMELEPVSSVIDSDYVIVDSDDEGTRIISIGDLRGPLLDFAAGGLKSIDTVVSEEGETYFLVSVLIENDDGTTSSEVYMISWANLNNTIYGMTPISTSDVEGCWT